MGPVNLAVAVQELLDLQCRSGRGLGDRTGSCFSTRSPATGRVFLLVFGGFAICCVSTTIARFVYPPPRRWGATQHISWSGQGQTVVGRLRRAQIFRPNTDERLCTALCRPALRPLAVFLRYSRQGFPTLSAARSRFRGQFEKIQTCDVWQFPRGQIEHDRGL